MLSPNPKKNIYAQLRIMIKPPFKEGNFRCAVAATKFAYFIGTTRKNSQPIIMKDVQFKRNSKYDKNGYLAIEIDPVALFESKTGITKVQYNPNDRSSIVKFEIYQKDTKGNFKKVQDVYGNWFYEGEAPTILTWGVTQGTNGTDVGTKKAQEIKQFPFLIAKSQNYLFDQDSKHSKGAKLPAKYSTRQGLLYTTSKDNLLSELKDLMASGSMGASQEAAKKLAEDFSKNKNYSLDHTYSNQTLINNIKNSMEFKNYVIDVSKIIQGSVRKNNNKVNGNNGKILVDEPIKRLYFDGGDWNANYWSTGLSITIHQVSYVEVWVDGIVYENGNPKSLNTTFILYDTYGLDMQDMEKYGGLEASSSEAWQHFSKRDKRAQVLSTSFGWEFNCWWAMQYYHDCVPLLLKLRISNVQITL